MVQGVHRLAVLYLQKHHIQKVHMYGTRAGGNTVSKVSWALVLTKCWHIRYRIWDIAYIFLLFYLSAVWPAAGGPAYMFIKLMFLRFLCRGYRSLQPVHGRTRGRRGMSHMSMRVLFNCMGCVLASVL